MRGLSEMLIGAVPLGGSTRVAAQDVVVLRWVDQLGDDNHTFDPLRDAVPAIPCRFRRVSSNLADGHARWLLSPSLRPERCNRARCRDVAHMSPAFDVELSADLISAGGISIVRRARLHQGSESHRERERERGSKGKG